MSGTGYGYGICGHKNTCCGVMNGNYVEDQYGRDWQMAGGAICLVDEQSPADPKDMVDRAGDADKFQANPLDDSEGVSGIALQPRRRPAGRRRPASARA